MKKVALVILLMLVACLAPRAYAQENVAAGGLASAVYYMGDFNHDQPLYQPGMYVGGMIGYSFSDYYSLRVTMGGGQLRGDPATYDGRLMSSSPGQRSVPFKRSYFDADVRLEVGFLPYDPFGNNPKQFRYTPYFSLGAGLGYAGGAPFMQTPISFGFKYRLFYRVSMGVEWAFRKTFNDNLDGWENIRTTETTFHNNDWISYVGVYFTYQLADRLLCPALK
ncbi:MAG: DUF6089 family protein [Prevotellaceae bacterium]|jgi:hypothetical protein|nr:DUF6089 family protein [Prevotellaceae bacterium]